MAGLLTGSRFASPDAAYQALAAAHRGLGEAESAAFNARLVLILANHIGDQAVLEAAIALAARSGGRQAEDQAGEEPIIAFSSEVDTGSREENASKQQHRTSVLIPSEPKRF